MTISILLYSVLVGVLLYGGARALERFVLDRHGEVRYVWLSALLITVMLPLAVSASGGHFLPGSLAAADETMPLWTVGMWWSALQASLLMVDHLGTGLWLGFSTIIATGFTVWMVRTRLRLDSFESVRLDDTDVLVGDVGSPAVFGFVEPRIVLPKWALDLPDHERDYIIKHELQHIRGHDQLVVLAGVLSMLLNPFNPIAWLMLRRLKLAIELDCDARVLGGAGTDVRSYGSVLIEVSRRVSRAPIPAISFAEGRSHLESRICNMTRGSERGSASGLVLVLVALVAVVGVAALPDPTTGPCLIDYMAGLAP